MDKKSYYMILGVSSAEQVAEVIRAAYATSLKRFSPGRSGGRCHPRVPGDQRPTTCFPRSGAATRLHTTNSGGRRTGGLRVVRGSPGPADASRSPSWAAPKAFGRRSRPCTTASCAISPRSGTESERLEGLNFELLLSPEEVSRGCVVPGAFPSSAAAPSAVVRDGTGCTRARTVSSRG